MSTSLQRALERIAGLPESEQDAIAAEILATLDDEEAWNRRLLKNVK